MARSLFSKIYRPVRCQLPLHRRPFLTTGVGSLVAGIVLTTPWSGAISAREASNSAHGPIRITDVETHDIKVDYLDWLQHELNHYYGPEPAHNLCGPQGPFILKTRFKNGTMMYNMGNPKLHAFWLFPMDGG